MVSNKSKAVQGPLALFLKARGKQLMHQELTTFEMKQQASFPRSLPAKGLRQVAIMQKPPMGPLAKAIQYYKETKNSGFVVPMPESFCKKQS